MAVALFQVRMPSTLAAVGPSLIPMRLGQTIIWRDKKYTAIRLGKKLIWNKGVAIPVKQSSPTSAPATTPNATPSHTPSSTPTPEVKLTGPFDVVVAASTEVPNGETRIFYPSDSRLKGKGFVITREKNSLIAFDNNCTHETCPVEMASPNLVCNCHDSYFNKITGYPVGNGPASEPLKSYPVKEVAGQILVTDSY